jgi:predicted  nucleic acid-binding Zn ribbon protein
MLRDSLGDNPLNCVECNGEVAPERIGFDAQLAEDIASWRSVHRSLFCLWLDSGEYENWAAERLADPQGQVNVRGREVVERLNSIIRAYYWWFRDTDASDGQISAQCPICRGHIAAAGDRSFGKCDACLVLI